MSGMFDILIGNTSSGDAHHIDLMDIPLLMISYCDEAQLSKVFSQFGSFGNQNYLISHSRKIEQFGLDKDAFLSFIKDEPESGAFKSRMDLTNEVLNEIILRQKLLKSKKIEDFKRYHALNTWNEIKLDYRFLIIDDIWDIISSKPKKLSLNLMMAMLYGPAVGVHTIFASNMSYRNLLQQLVSIHPVLTLELKKKYGTPEPKQLAALGHELIYSTEDFIYYKKGTVMDMERYFK